MHQDQAYQKQDGQRLKILIASRIVIITVFFLVTFFFNKIAPAVYVTSAVFYSVYAMIILMFVMSLFYTLLLRNAKYFLINVYFQLVVDILLVTLLVYVTGSIGSNYSLLYSLIIIYSAIFLGRKGAVIVASASSIAYGLVIDLEYFRVIPTAYSTGRDYSIEAGDVLVRIIVHIISFYLLAFLASIVVEQEKKTRTLLEEKESAFDQLDLLFRSIIESVDTGVMTTTFQGRIKTFNRAAEYITGFSYKSVINRQIQEVFPDFSVIFDMNEQEIVRSRREVDVINSQGKLVNLGCSVSSLKDRKGDQIGYILIFQDLTDIKKMEEKLSQSKKMALIGEMAAGLAHEMRNPLASITGSIQLLAQTAHLSDTDKRLMQIILRGKEHLDHFVRDFLLLSRPVPEKRELVNFREVVEEVLENVRLSGEWRENIHVSTGYSGKMSVWANKEQIRQIVSNLINNALQAMEPDGHLKLEIHDVKLEDKNEYTEFIVADDGCGIEEKDLIKVFEPFFTNKEKGTGLGLAIVSRLVDGYGGKITIESKSDQGTTARVWLPCS